MSSIQVIVDKKRAEAALNNIKSRQFPFALAKTLTETAEACRQAVGIQSRRTFKLHTEFIPRNIRKQSAKKSEIKATGRGEASVFTGKRLDGWMGLQETGGTKKPVGGGALTLPAEGLRRLSYKTGTGAVKKRYTPKRLLEEYNRTGGKHSVRKAKQKRAKKHPFIIRSKTTGVLMIAKRKGKRRFPLKILYVFHREAQIRPIWGFEKAVKTTATLVFEKKFDRNMRHAIATAK